MSFNWNADSSIISWTWNWNACNMEIFWLHFKHICQPLEFYMFHLGENTLLSSGPMLDQYGSKDSGFSWLISRCLNNSTSKNVVRVPSIRRINSKFFHFSHFAECWQSYFCIEQAYTWWIAKWNRNYHNRSADGSCSEGKNPIKCLQAIFWCKFSLLIAVPLLFVIRLLPRFLLVWANVYFWYLHCVINPAKRAIKFILDSFDWSWHHSQKLIYQHFPHTLRGSDQKNLFHLRHSFVSMPT